MEPSTEPTIELPGLPKQPSKSLNQEAMERRQKIGNVAKTIGIWNLNKKTLAKEFKVSERTIYKDINWIIGHFKPQDIRQIKIQLEIGRNKALNEALHILATVTDPKLKLDAVKTVLEALRAYREELEAWGEKTKIPDKLDVRSKEVIFKIVKDGNNLEANSQAVASMGDSTGPEDN